MYFDSYLSNRFGIPRIEPSALTIGTTNVSLTVPMRKSFLANYNGLILMKFTDTITSGTTTTLPIVLSTEAGTLDITLAGDTALTVADYTLGIHLFYYESSSKTMQLIA